MAWLDPLTRLWPDLAAGFSLLASLLASIHAVLNKRDSRAATLWLGFIWFLPLFGPILYLLLGVNRIRRRALSLRAQNAVSCPIPEDMGEPQKPEAEHLHTLARAVEHVVDRPLTAGNRIQALVNGDQAFPAMLAAIESATRTISFSTYIFDRDPWGGRFAAALGRAVARGVTVRVLIDDTGARYSCPTILHDLRRHRIPVARFLPALTSGRLMAINLRNHRKAMVVDGRTGFAGGMNIRAGNVLADQPKNPVQDLQFGIQGPAVAQLQEVFVNDWAFCTREILEGDGWFPALEECGRLVARVIADGPDADFEKLRWTLLAALADAQSSVQILTPYFLPDMALISALNLAALRGVRVDILLPGRNNLPFVHWASRAMWWQVLERGCHLWLTPPPFDHSKLMIVDHHWVLFGSANWDARSLRLNFELNVECYGRDFAHEMDILMQRKRHGAREVTLAQADGRPFLGRLRDGAARLFSPYL